MLDMQSVLRNLKPYSESQLGGAAGWDIDHGASSGIGHRWSISPLDKNVKREVLTSSPLGGCSSPPHKGSSPSWINSSKHFDITIYVGRNRAPYTVSSQTLQGSSYFRMKIESIRRDKFDPVSPAIRSTASPPPPLVVDSDETVFQNMLCVLRYGSLEALPKMAEADLYRLKKELEFYGVEWPEIISRRKNSSSFSEIGMVVPKSSSPLPTSAGSPKPSVLNDVSAPGGVPFQRHVLLEQMPEFPSEIAHPANLILVQLADNGDSAARCSCTRPNQMSTWALSFFYRYVFCTGCSKSSTDLMPPKYLAEMFMAVAGFYSGDQKVNSRKWNVWCDSTCILKCFKSRCCSCSCSRQSVYWVVSTYHSHAFCYQCGAQAVGSTLICILLTVRYGGLYKSPCKAKKTDQISHIPITRETPKLQPAPSYKQRS